MSTNQITKNMYRVLRRVAEKYPWLAQWYRDFRDGRALHKPAKDCPLGFKFIGNPSMEAGTFEQDDVKIIKKCLCKTEVFINVGANIGYYCCIALREKKQTVAFEPIELNLKYLYKNIAANTWQDNIEIFPAAVGDKSGLIEIYGGGTAASLIQGWSHTPSYYRRWVPITTLDLALGKRFEGRQSLILVDIEGAENAMLRGASVLLQSALKPVWIVEISVSGHQPEGVKVNPDLLSTFQRFWSQGYEAWTCGSVMRPVYEREVQEVMTTGKDTLKSLNYLFCAPGVKK
jgi:FkbM family methyltransferase